MSWARLDDQYTDHPKIVQVGPLGMALHVAAICYCARYLTDGFVPAAMIPRLISLDGIKVTRNGVTNVVSHKTITDELTNVGLFDIVPGGYMVHDYLLYNPPAERVKAERAENASRQAEWRARRRGFDGRFGGNSVTNTVTNDDVTPAPSPSPSPSNIEEKDSADKSASTKRVKDERLVHPAILLVKGVTGHYPPKGAFDLVIERLGDSPDGKRFAKVYETWTARGFKPTNIDGQLNWYRDGIPPARGNVPGNGSPRKTRILTGADGKQIEVEE